MDHLNLTIDRLITKLKDSREETEEVKEIAEWASGKDFQNLKMEYEKQKKAFPEFHE